MRPALDGGSDIDSELVGADIEPIAVGGGVLALGVGADVDGTTAGDEHEASRAATMSTTTPEPGCRAPGACAAQSIMRLALRPAGSAWPPSDAGVYRS